MEFTGIYILWLVITIKLTLAVKIRYLNILSGQLFQIGGTESILKKHKEVVEIKSRVSKYQWFRFRALVWLVLYRVKAWIFISLTDHFLKVYDMFYFLSIYVCSVSWHHVLSYHECLLFFPFLEILWLRLLCSSILNWETMICHMCLLLEWVCSTVVDKFEQKKKKI